MRLISIILLIICTLLSSSCDQISSNGKVKLDEKLVKIDSAQAADISPETLRPLFELGSEHTDLQRENAKKQIKNKIIEWDLQIYEISSTNKDGVYKIQTMTGVKDGNPLFSKSDRKNFNVGTFINLYARSETEKQFILSLKTSDWIKVKGVLTGESTLRNLEIDPAILVLSKTLNAQGQTQNKGDEQNKNGNFLSKLNAEKFCPVNQILMKDAAAVSFDGPVLKIVEKYECFKVFNKSKDEVSTGCLTEKDAQSLSNRQFKLAPDDNIRVVGGNTFIVLYLPSEAKLIIDENFIAGAPSYIIDAQIFQQKIYKDIKNTIRSERIENANLTKIEFDFSDPDIFADDGPIDLFRGRKFTFHSCSAY